MTDFIKYGRWDTEEHAKNGLKGKDADKIANARNEAYKILEKQKKLIREGKI